MSNIECALLLLGVAGLSMIGAGHLVEEEKESTQSKMHMQINLAASLYMHDHLQGSLFSFSLV